MPPNSNCYAYVFWDKLFNGVQTNFPECRAISEIQNDSQKNGSESTLEVDELSYKLSTAIRMFSRSRRSMDVRQTLRDDNRQPEINTAAKNRKSYNSAPDALIYKIPTAIYLCFQGRRDQQKHCQYRSMLIDARKSIWRLQAGSFITQCWGHLPVTFQKLYACFQGRRGQ
jgi:hypothetical protein